MMNKRCLVSWSGGKDSCYALHNAIRSGLEPALLLNVLNEEGKISRSHGIPSAVLEAQADAMNLPVHMIASSWQDYEAKFTGALTQLKKDYHLSTAVFGDVDLEDHRLWEEKVCLRAGLEAVLPLWKASRKELVIEMLDWGMQALIVSCNEKMGPRFIGQKLTPTLLSELEGIGIDPCGENGEFHTLVTDCPLFKDPLDVTIDHEWIHQQFWLSRISLRT